MENEQRESLEDEASHATDEARMVLPGVQAILGFQLVAVFNQRFHDLTDRLQFLHLVAFLFLAVAMGLIMAPAAYHRRAEPGCLTRRFVNFASLLAGLLLFLVALWFVVPQRARRARERARSEPRGAA